jgi:hypothetical protein
MSPVVLFEIIVGTLALLAVLALAYIFVRRRLLSSGAPLMLCALLLPGRSSYRLGLLRFSGSTLEWFTLIGPSPRPVRIWDRPRLELGPPEAAEEAISGLPDAVTVACRYDGEAFRIGLAGPAYTAMRSWLESSPPGFNVNVA